MITKDEAGQLIRQAKFRAGVSWAQLAEAIGKDPVWTVSALLGQHPVSAADAATVTGLLGLGEEIGEVLRMPPYRGSGRQEIPTDPTLYRFYEALDVYGPALKELIHEEFGDGIMSAINLTGSSSTTSGSKNPAPETLRVTGAGLEVRLNSGLQY